MKLRFFLVIFLALSSANAIAQNSNDKVRTHFGIYGDLGLNSHSANFQKLPGVPSCCPRYESGTGTGVSLGALMEFPLADNLLLSLRAGYSSLNATLSTSEPLPVIINGQLTTIFSEHTVAASLSNVGIEPLIGYRLFGNMYLQLGGRLGFTMQKTYDQKEQIMPEYPGTFGDGRRVNNELSGDIPNASGIAASLMFGGSYDLPLNKDRTFIIAPEVFYSLGLNQLASDLDWKANTIRFGLVLKYSPKPAAATPIEPVKEVIPERKEIVVDKAKTYALSASVTAVSVDEAGVESTVATRFRIEEFVSSQMSPLLNYIFFDENSAELPARYTRVLPSETNNFQVEKLRDASTIEVYYQVLNVIGKRMTQAAAATITLTGSNADIGAEKGNTTLSRQRAESIKNYLVSNWKIDESRIKIEAPRNLPEKPSNPEKPEGAAENRRVEVRASIPELLDPVIINDTIVTATPMIRFRPKAIAEAGIFSWKLTASQNGKTLKEFTGRSTLDEVLEWKSDDDRKTIPRTSEPIRYALDVRDEAGQATGAIGELPVELISIQKKRSEQLDDKQIDRYNLILFEFDKAELSSTNSKLVDFIKRRISPEATVNITGYSDEVGDDDYNLRLSGERAKSAARALNSKNPTVKGVGETQPLFTNELPEGRFYNRTVEIVVITPVKK
ncbi:MAG: OmpA family protein [Ignavibacteria bacterium]|nr:OmpA family protein [Ignavibacteria bacterium]